MENRLTAALFLSLWLTASCNLPEVPPEKSASLPTPLPALSVCEAAKRPVKSRLRVAGGFGGFADDTNSRNISLKGKELCNEQGTGLVFATLSNDAEGEKLLETRSGVPVVIEGTVDKIEQGRFTTLSNAVVVNASQ